MQSVVNIARSQIYHMFTELQCVVWDLSATADPCLSFWSPLMLNFCTLNFVSTNNSRGCTIADRSCASWSLVCMVQIWSKSVEKSQHLRPKKTKSRLPPVETDPRLVAGICHCIPSSCYCEQGVSVCYSLIGEARGIW